MPLNIDDEIKQEIEQAIEEDTSLDDELVSAARSKRWHDVKTFIVNIIEVIVPSLIGVMTAAATGNPFVGTGTATTVHFVLRYINVDKLVETTMESLDESVLNIRGVISNIVDQTSEAFEEAVNDLESGEATLDEDNFG